MKNNMIEVALNDEDSFLKIKETLTRIGIVGKFNEVTGKTPITQSCHILHKRDQNTGFSRYFIVHFKEMFLLDNKNATLTEKDISRRNRIIKLLEDWNFIEIISPREIVERNMANMNDVRVIKYSDKEKYEFHAKYTLGRR